MLEYLNASTLKTGLELFLAILGIAVTILIWRLKEMFVTRADFLDYQKNHDVKHGDHEKEHVRLDDRHQDVERRLEDGAEKFATIIADLEHLPDHKDIADLKDRIGDVEGSVKALSATINGLKEVLERVERPLNILVEHHMSGGGK